MNRPLTAAELAERASAALRSGAFSRGVVGELQRKRYDAIRWRFRRALQRTVGHSRTSWAWLEILQQIARYDALIALADAHLETLAHPLVQEDGRTPWPLVERRDGWMAERMKLVKQLPGGTATGNALDLAGALSKRRAS